MLKTVLLFLIAFFLAGILTHVAQMHQLMLAH